MKLTERQYLILYQLSKNKVLTAKELSYSLNVSERTIKKEIKFLKEYLIPFNATLLSQQGLGYRIENVENIPLNPSEYVQTLKHIHDFSQNNSERISYCLQSFLKDDVWHKIDDLADEIFVSASTLQNDLIEVRNLLANYQLKLVAKPNYGLKIQGTAFNRYLAIAEYFFHNKLTVHAPSKTTLEHVIDDINDLEFITEIVAEETNQVQWSFSDYTLKNIAIHIAILIKNRHVFGMEPCFIQNTLSLIVAQNIVQRLSLSLNEAELSYLAAHLEAKRILQEEPEHNKKMDQMFEGMLDEISNNFNISFRSNEQLLKNLKMHLAQMIVRLERGLSIRNPLLYDFLREFVFASKITVSACSILELYYPHVKVNPDEFGYLVLYFQTGLIEMYKQTPLVIGICDNKSRAELDLYETMIRNNFTSSEIQVRKINLEEQVDIGVGLDVRPRNASYNFLVTDHNFLSRLQYTIQHYDMLSLERNTYFRKEYMLDGIAGSTKEEVTVNILQAMDQLNLLKEYYDDPFYSLELGSGMVHLQDLKKHISRSVCLFVKLEQPVIWNTTSVRFLFLIKTKQDRDRDLYPISNMISEFVSNEKKVKELWNNFSFDTLKKLLS